MQSNKYLPRLFYPVCWLTEKSASVPFDSNVDPLRCSNIMAPTSYRGVGSVARLPSNHHGGVRQMTFGHAEVTR